MHGTTRINLPKITFLHVYVYFKQFTCTFSWVTRHLASLLLKSVVKFKHLAMYILYTRQCCSTTWEVITTALYRKHWRCLPGRAERHQAGCAKNSERICKKQSSVIWLAKRCRWYGLYAQKVATIFFKSVDNYCMSTKVPISINIARSSDINHSPIQESTPTCTHYESALADYGINWWDIQHYSMNGIRFTSVDTWKSRLLKYETKE